MYIYVFLCIFKFLMYVYVYSCMFAGLMRWADQDTVEPVYEAVFNGNSLKSSKIVNFAFFAKFESFPITSKKENLRFSEVNGFIWWTVRDSNPRPAD